MKKTPKERPPTDAYAVSLELGRDVEKALKNEQARRYLNGETKPTVRALAAELLTKAALSLAA